MVKNLNKKTETEIFFENAYNKALNIGRYFCKDNDLAKEIAQLTTVKLYYKKDEVKSPDKWIYQVARNNALQILKKQQRNQELNREIELMKKNDNLPDVIEHPQLEKVILDLPSGFMNDIDKNIAFDYFCNDLKKSQISAKYDIDMSKINDKLYHLRQEIILYLKLEGDFFYIRNISGTRLNRNINNFIQRFTECLNKKDYSNLSHFTDNFKDFEVFNELPCIDKIKTFEIKKKNNEYKLMIICLTAEEDPFVTFFTVTFKDFKKIDSISKPALPDKAYRVNSKDLGEFTSVLKLRKRNGQFYCTKKEIDEIIRITGAVDEMKLRK